MSAHIDFRPDDISAFCQRWQIVELALFGSVLRDDFVSESDVDILVRFAQATRPAPRNWLAMERELSAILGREVDLIERQSVEGSRNYIRRKAILDSAQIVYAA